MRNRTEQNRTEQNSVDVLGLSVKHYFQKSDTGVGSFHSERINRVINKLNKPWMTQHHTSTYSEEV